jgi:iron(III) transport system permease protein
MRRSPVTIALALFVLLVFVAYVVYPVGMMFAESLHVNGAWSVGHYRSLFDPANSANREAVVNSVLVSLASVILSAIVGIFFAFVFTQIRFPFRVFLSRLAILPIALPPLVGVIAFLFVFGESGVIPRVLQWLLHTSSVPFSLDGISAIVVVHVYSFYVYFYLFVSDALRQLDGSLLEASASLGSTPWRTFRKVILPQLRPALTGASVLTFMASMASFSAPLIFAGEKRFITLQIYSTKLNGEMDLAAAESMLLLLVSVVFFILLNVSRGSQAVLRQTKGASTVRELAVPRSIRAVMIVMISTLLLFEILPIAAILLISLAQEGSWTTQILPPVYTVENYARLLADPHVFEPIMNSLLMGLWTLTGCVVVGVVASYVVVKGAGRRFRGILDIVLTLPYAIPGTVVAISLILAFNRPVPQSGFEILVGTFWILPLAYFVRMYPLVVRSASAALEQLDDSLLEAAETFGAGVIRRITKVVLPIITPAIVSGGVLVVITALGEFVSSVLIYSYSNRPISIEILAQLRTFNFGSAAAYSVVLLLIILLVILLANLISRKRDGVTAAPII